MSFDFIEFGILRYVLHCSNFFGARLENLKVNKRDGGGPNNSRGGGFFFKKISGGAFIWDLIVYCAPLRKKEKGKRSHYLRCGNSLLNHVNTSIFNTA